MGTVLPFPSRPQLRLIAERDATVARNLPAVTRDVLPTIRKVWPAPQGWHNRRVFVIDSRQPGRVIGWHAERRLLIVVLDSGLERLSIAGNLTLLPDPAA
jgi:hypothetical protein